jgi:hypothetical protein
MTKELQKEIEDNEKNDERGRLRARGKKVTELEWKIWRRQRRIVNKSVRHAKGESLGVKACRDVVHSRGMYRGVIEHLGWRGGGGPGMLIEDGKVLRNPEEMRECISRTYKRMRKWRKE